MIHTSNHIQRQLREWEGGGDRRPWLSQGRIVQEDEIRRWVENDDALRARARALAAQTGRDPEDLYRTLRQLARTPSARLELGLRHARLRVHGR